MGKIRHFRIDWINHIIGFFSTLLGIYIAFQLENYRENAKEKEKVEIVKQLLKKEIEDNLKIYKTNTDKLSSWLEYEDFLNKKNDDKLGGLVVGSIELSKMIKKQPDRLSKLRVVKTINDTLKVYESDLIVDVAPEMGISTSNWNTAVASGIVNSMDYSLIVNLSQIYDWTERDIGTSEEELFENFLGINKAESFADWDKLVTHYRNLARVHALKYDQIKRIYSKTDWNK